MDLQGFGHLLLSGTWVTLQLALLSLLLGLILVCIGAVTLVDGLGIISFSVGDLLSRLWPLILVGLGFLIPLDLSFSMWFFFVVRKLMQVWAVAMPIRMMPPMYGHHERTVATRISKPSM